MLNLRLLANLENYTTLYSMMQFSVDFHTYEDTYNFQNQTSAQPISLQLGKWMPRKGRRGQRVAEIAQTQLSGRLGPASGIAKPLVQGSVEKVPSA